MIDEAPIVPVTGTQDGQDRGQKLAERLGLTYLAGGDFPESQPVEIPFAVVFLRQYRFLPLRIDDGLLRVIMADPTDVDTVDAIRMYSGCEVEPVVGEEVEILEAVERLYGSGATTVRKIIDDLGEGEMEVLSGPAEEDEEHLRDMASEAPVIRLVNLLITRAADVGASDIHFEPFEDRLVVRYRIDGVLREKDSPPKGLQRAIISRLKLMAKMNIAERRLPQDGKVRVRLADRSIDIRVSTVPTVFGESLVMRLLDRTSDIISLEALGFSGRELVRFESMITRPHGMILVTGPTGSGKTTTLYAALDRIRSSEKKIITIEDPVEYQVAGVNQIHVMSKIGLTFASGLRSIVRQDPDIIMVGEIRDRETADIAVHAALTGHLVFSTVHTNDAPGAVTRLVDMGLEGFLIASSVVGILAQRLVRRVCPDCSVPQPPDPALLARLGAESLTDDAFAVGEGCASCNKTGYRGRTGAFELMTLSEEVKKLILENTSAGVLREAAVRGGMRILREDGLEKARKGITSLSEIFRISEED